MIGKPAFCGFLLACCAAAGCGGGAKADVTGKVYLGNKPLAMGSVTYIGSDGLPCHSPIASDGSYHVKNLAVGNANILVVSPNPAEKVKGRGGPAKFPDRANPIKEEGKEDPNWFPISSEYGQIASPRISYAVVAGTNSYDIHLEENPKKK